MKTHDTITTYNHLCDLLRNNSKVYYSRFGDGDFYIMNGRREKMHKHSTELQKELTEAFLIKDSLYVRGAMVNSPTEKGMRNGVFASPPTNSLIVNWLTENQKIPADTVFHNSIMFHYLSVFKQDKMMSFLEEFIRPRQKMFIGCVPKESIEKLVGPIKYYVQVPSSDAYYTINDWWPKILENIDDVSLCLPAAGMAGRVIQKRLWNLEKNIHSLDLGSVVDAACNLKTRTWIAQEGNKVGSLLL